MTETKPPERIWLLDRKTDWEWTQVRIDGHPDVEYVRADLARTVEVGCQHCSCTCDNCAPCGDPPMTCAHGVNQASRCEKCVLEGVYTYALTSVEVDVRQAAEAIQERFLPDHKTATGVSVAREEIAALIAPYLCPSDEKMREACIEEVKKYAFYQAETKQKYIAANEIITALESLSVGGTSDAVKSNRQPHVFQEHPHYPDYCAFAVGSEDYCKREKDNSIHSAPTEGKV